VEVVTGMPSRPVILAAPAPRWKLCDQLRGHRGSAVLKRRNRELGSVLRKVILAIISCVTWRRSRTKGLISCAPPLTWFHHCSPMVKRLQ
jgi:hypothetical protein